MKTTKGKTTAIVTVALGFVALTASGILLKDRILFWWYLEKLESGKPDEQIKAANGLLEMASVSESPQALEAVQREGNKVIRALVNAVDLSEKILVLSAGHDQQVGYGQAFLIHRDGKLVGAGQIIKVYPDLSGARILRTRDETTILRGDKAVLLPLISSTLKQKRGTEG